MGRIHLRPIFLCAFASHDSHGFHRFLLIMLNLTERLLFVSLLNLVESVWGFCSWRGRGFVECEWLSWISEFFDNFAFSVDNAIKISFHVSRHAKAVLVAIKSAVGIYLPSDFCHAILVSRYVARVNKQMISCHINRIFLLHAFQTSPVNIVICDGEQPLRFVHKLYSAFSSAVHQVARLYIFANILAYQNHIFPKVALAIWTCFILWRI